MQIESRAGVLNPLPAERSNSVGLTSTREVRGVPARHPGFTRLGGDTADGHRFKASRSASGSASAFTRASSSEGSIRPSENQFRRNASADPVHQGQQGKSDARTNQKDGLPPALANAAQQTWDVTAGAGAAAYGWIEGHPEAANAMVMGGVGLAIGTAFPGPLINPYTGPALTAGFVTAVDHFRGTVALVPPLLQGAAALPRAAYNAAAAIVRAPDLLPEEMDFWTRLAPYFL